MSLRLLTGIKPTGTLHLGNYVGAMRPTLSLMDNPSFKAFLFIADAHALTSVTDGTLLREQTRAIAAAWLAMGLDPARVTFYRQTHVPQVFELFWTLSCLCPKGLMNRAHAYKAVIQPLKDKGLSDVDQNVSMGLYNYPVLMAADILFLGGQRVPVGADQLQHVEIARDLAIKFNQIYGDILVVPEAYVQKDMPSLRGLDGQKMSKSYGNVIPLFSETDALRRLIFKIKTDSKRPEEPKDPEECTLFALHQALAEREQTDAVRARYQTGIGWAEMKELTFQVVEAVISPLRQSYNQLMSDPKHIDAALYKGEARARDEAEIIMKRVRTCVGFT